MPTYKLSYFNITALGEPIRYLLSYGKAPFEDHRVEKEEWFGDASLKASMPFGQMPVLEIDGKKTHQSLAICRYLGKLYGIAGDSEWEALQIDIIAETITDLRTKIGAIHYNANEDAKPALYEVLNKETLPYYLTRLDKIAKENNGYFANGKLSWVDLFFAAFLPYINVMAKQDITEKYPNLQHIVKNVNNLPAIKEWIEKRPKTDV